MKAKSILTMRQVSKSMLGILMLILFCGITNGGILPISNCKRKILCTLRSLILNHAGTPIFCYALQGPRNRGVGSAHWCVFQISKRHQQTSLLIPFLKNSDKFRKLYLLALLGEIGGNIPKMALLLGVWENFFFEILT